MIDLILLGVVLAIGGLGVFFGFLRHLGTLLGMLIGYVAAALGAPHVVPSLAAALGAPPLVAAAAWMSLNVSLLGWGAALVARTISRRIPFSLPAVLHSIVGALAWTGAASLILVAELGAIALEEPDGQLLADRLGIQLRSSRVYSRARSLASCISCRRTPKRPVSPGTRSITSMTR